VAVACGGSTGREGLVDPALTQQTAGDDATTAPFDAGLFDVAIQYADRNLPEISAPPAADGGEAGYPWPNCPPFLPVYPDGCPGCLEVDESPAAFAADGAVVPAPDGSACATYGWLGSTAIDECVTYKSAGYSASDCNSPFCGNDYDYFPPCNWVIDAGTAKGGTRTGDSRYAICLDLYACIMKTGCGTNSNATYCLCGPNGANCDGGGPCGPEELAALEYLPGMIQNAGEDLTNVAPEFAGSGGGRLNAVFQFARTDKCFDGGQP
jgi:hypothetical protein